MRRYAPKRRNTCTRATVHFEWNGKAQAIVYRHSDGYPEGLGKDLKQFFKDVQAQTGDTRFDDPSYLAAKFVVWQAAQYARHYNYETKSYEQAQPLDFLGVGVCQEDPSDIEYRYHASCDSDKTPKVRIEKERLRKMDERKGENKNGKDGLKDTDTD